MKKLILLVMIASFANAYTECSYYYKQLKKEQRVKQRAIGYNWTEQIKYADIAIYNAAQTLMVKCEDGTKEQKAGIKAYNEYKKNHKNKFD